MAQQTAVEWLVEQLKSKGHALITSEGVFINVPDDLFLEAKAMEKEQIKFAYNDGADAIVANKYKAMEDYYNELYQSSQDKTDK
jgi:hypothetical protein